MPSPSNPHLDAGRTFVEQRLEQPTNLSVPFVLGHSDEIGQADVLALFVAGPGALILTESFLHTLQRPRGTRGSAKHNVPPLYHGIYPEDAHHISAHTQEPGARLNVR
jgi:hypothetical protein